MVMHFGYMRLTSTLDVFKYEKGLEMRKLNLRLTSTLDVFK